MPGFLSKTFTLGFFLCARFLVFCTCGKSTPCPNHTLTVLNDTKEGFTCFPCSLLMKCPPGFGLSVSCDTKIGNDTLIECVRCELGKSFSSTHDSTSCQSCKSLQCSPQEVVHGVCNRFKDNTVCSGKCKKCYSKSASGRCELLKPSCYTTTTVVTPEEATSTHGGSETSTHAGSETMSTHAGSETMSTQAASETMSTHAGSQTSTHSRSEIMSTHTGSETMSTHAGSETTSTHAGSETTSTPGGSETTSTPGGSELSWHFSESALSIAIIIVICLAVVVIVGAGISVWCCEKCWQYGGEDELLIVFKDRRHNELRLLGNNQNPEDSSSDAENVFQNETVSSPSGTSDVLHRMKVERNQRTNSPLAAPEPSNKIGHPPNAESTFEVEPLTQLKVQIPSKLESPDLTEYLPKVDELLLKVEASSVKHLPKVEPPPNVEPPPIVCPPPNEPAPNVEPASNLVPASNLEPPSAVEPGPNVEAAPNVAPPPNVKPRPIMESPLNMVLPPNVEPAPTVRSSPDVEPTPMVKLPSKGEPLLIFEPSPKVESSPKVEPLCEAKPKECKKKLVRFDDINPDNYRKIYQPYNTFRLLGGDFKALGGELKYVKRDVEVCEQQLEPAKHILDDWGRKPGNTVFQFLNIVSASEKIYRNDVLDILKSELRAVTCDCGDCPII